ncbi:hypothetical protein NPIL_407981 [Nephila pilipes]|uniref:Uncharacterized protein n=1 Tax=Nephila pilipes TaxID=299642 RepID=A0A8X6PJG0_NEPPI|nr:hypothetical protein NPIL_407981 [Nephila pilipes]
MSINEENLENTTTLAGRNKPRQLNSSSLSLHCSMQVNERHNFQDTPFHCEGINHDLTMVNWLPYKKAKLTGRTGNTPILKFIQTCKGKYQFLLKTKINKFTLKYR